MTHIENMATDLAVLLQQGLDIHQAKDRMNLSDDLWSKVVDAFCSSLGN